MFRKQGPFEDIEEFEGRFLCNKENIELSSQVRFLFYELKNEEIFKSSLKIIDRNRSILISRIMKLTIHRFESILNTLT